MNTAYARKIRLGYGIFLGVFTAVIAILFIIEAADIYYGGAGSLDVTYSREIVGERLKQILIPVILWLVAVVAGYVLSVIFPYTEGKKKPASTAHTALKRLKKRIPNAESEEFLAEKKNFNRMEMLRIGFWSLGAAFGLAAAIVSIVYLSDISHFPAAEPNSAVIGLLRSVLPWIGVTFLLFIVATLFEHFSARRELDSVKRLLVLGKGAPVVQSALLAKKDAALQIAGSWQVRLGVRVALFAVALVFITVGILGGGWEDTLSKAINICTECIGLG